MRHTAAYAMLVLGGKEKPIAGDVEKVVKEAGVEVDKANSTAFCEAFKGKPFHDLVSEGIKALGSMGDGSGPTAASAPTNGAATTKEEPQEKEPEEEVDLGGMFGDEVDY